MYQAKDLGLDDNLHNVVRDVQVVQKYIDLKMTFTKRCVSLVQLTRVLTSRDAYVCFLDSFDEGQIPIKEFFYVMALNRACRLLGIYKVSEGGIAATIVDMRIVVKFLLDMQASGAVICHNHPSGTLHPSNFDKEVTKKIDKALSLFEINLQDHIIITMDGYYSMQENGDF